VITWLSESRGRGEPAEFTVENSSNFRLTQATFKEGIKRCCFDPGRHQALNFLLLGFRVTTGPKKGTRGWEILRRGNLVRRGFLAKVQDPRDRQQDRPGPCGRASRLKERGGIWEDRASGEYDKEMGEKKRITKTFVLGMGLARPSPPPRKHERENQRPAFE